MGELRIEQQAELGSGADFWTTKSTGDVPAVTLTDGPHGVRRQRAAAEHVGLGDSEPATCFPPAVALAQTWDPDLVTRVAAAIGREAQALDVQVVLGPGVNIKRDPRCGRNFEYYSEDPHLAGVLGAAWVKGIQAEGVGASVKHFAVNNQEHDRMRVSADVDARALREIYLRPFQRVITTARPWTVMAAYNRINGEWATQNHWLLSRVLRDEWGFDGVVVSDWGAVVDRAASVSAGLDLQMPGGDAATDGEVVDAVARGTLPEAVAAAAAERVAELSRRATAARRPGSTFDVDAHHELAREAARRSIVLLRNDLNVLPLRTEMSVAVIGEFARTVRYQGGGSSHITSTRLDVPVDEIRARADGEVVFAAGYTTDGSGDASALCDNAVRAAAAADAAVLFLGLDESWESEGFDRADIDLPATQLDMLAAVAAVQPRTVVVLVHGGVLQLAPVTAPAVLDAALSGQGGGAAIADVLYGLANPSGKLAETVPLRLQDTPAYLNFPGEAGHVRYGEGIFVGYRWYDAREMGVAFPYGHGLSYTSFAYRDLHVSVEGDAIVARVTVANTGVRAGREIAQFYVGLPGSRVTRPPRTLAAFAGVNLAPGEQACVEVRLDRADLVYWDVRVDDWILEGGDYRVDVGASSRDIRATAVVTLTGDPVRVPLTLESTLAEVAAHPDVMQRLLALLSVGATLPVVKPAADGPTMAAMMSSIPVGRLPGFTGGKVTRKQLERVLAQSQ
jgi:beta-glucosidase